MSSTEIEIRKEAYSLGFKTAQKAYIDKLANDRIKTKKDIYKDIILTYQQTTGIDEDLFVRALNDWSNTVFEKETT